MRVRLSRNFGALHFAVRFYLPSIRDLCFGDPHPALTTNPPIFRVWDPEFKDVFVTWSLFLVLPRQCGGGILTAPSGVDVPSLLR